MKADLIYYLLRWCGGFCNIIDGMCIIFTGGFYNPWLSFKITAYSAKRSIKRRMIR